MKYDPFKHRRHSLRVRGYDYSRIGAYYITMVTHNRECLLGDVADGQVKLSPIGQVAHDFWQEIPRHFADVEMDEFIVMPNHVHGIIVIVRDAREPVGVEYIQPLQPHQPLQNETQHRYQHVIPRSVGSIIRTYKAAVRRWCNENGNEHFKWQRNYYEHIIRTDGDLDRIRAYIVNNPFNWQSDDENPKNIRQR